uniref:Uncharacterized protein n=1 Tax=Romanomermis culicivorax TaxID=13658 RepID=A0A915J795_ROMCU
MMILLLVVLIPAVVYGQQCDFSVLGQCMRSASPQGMPDIGDMKAKISKCFTEWDGSTSGPDLDLEKYDRRIESGFYTADPTGSQSDPGCPECSIAHLRIDQSEICSLANAANWDSLT